MIRLHQQTSMENKCRDNRKMNLFIKFLSRLITMHCWAFFGTCLHVYVFLSACVHVCLKSFLYLLTSATGLFMFTLSFLNCFNYISQESYCFHQSLHVLFSRGYICTKFGKCLSFLSPPCTFSYSSFVRFSL